MLRGDSSNSSAMPVAIGRLWFTIAAIASVFWLMLTEPVCQSQLWPSDVGAFVVGWLGGTASVSLTGAQETDLNWVSVFLRMTAATMVGSILQTVLFRHRFAVGVSRYEKWRAVVCLTEAGLRKSGVCAVLWLFLWLVASIESSGRLLNFLITTVPLSFGVGLALFLNGVLISGHLRTGAGVLQGGGASAASNSRIPGLKTWQFAVVLLCAVIWQSVSFRMNERLYAELLVPHGDSAMYEEHLWNVWHGKGFRSYLDQGLFVGEHIQVIHLLLLPLHMIWPSYLMMEWVASACLAVCVVPIYRLTLEKSGSLSAAMWLSLAWLLFFPMHYLDIAIDLKTLRPSCFGMPFLFFGIELAERRRTVPAGFCLLTALLTQEDFALITGSIGLIFFLREFRLPPAERSVAFQRWSVGVFLFSVIWVLLAVLVVIPAFRGGEVVHYSRYFGDLGSSPGELIRTTLTEPGRVAALFFSQRTLLYLLVLTLPVGLLPWRRPLVLSAGLVTFVMLSLIQLGNAPAGSEGAAIELPPVPYHHFHAPFLPVIFWAAAGALSVRDGRRVTVPELGAEAAGGRSWAAVSARFAFFCAAATALTGSLMPCGATFWSSESQYGWKNLYAPTERGEQFAKVLKRLPVGACVASTDYVHTRLTHFERSYDYSDYLRAVNQYRPGVPPDTDYIVIDTSHRYSQIHSPAEVRELREEPEKWELLPDETGGMFIVLKRRHGDEH